MIHVDIHTKRITPDTKIYMARPGAKYRFFDSFVDHSFVGPDLPNLELPKFDELSEVEDLAARVMRSAAHRRFRVNGGSSETAPSDDLADYESGSTNRSTSQMMRVVRGYFEGMAKGDLVVVPPSNFKGRAHIGELVEAPNEVRTLPSNYYNGMPLSGRRVRWLASMEKAKLPSQTLDALQKPSPLFLLSRTAWSSVLRRAYGSYAANGEFASRFEISAEKFSTKDDFRIQAFFNFVSANTARVSEGQSELLSLRDGAFEQNVATPDLFTNVNSPGGLALKSAIITPIVIAVMYTLAISAGPEAHVAAEQSAIVFGNSLAPDGDSCALEVREQVVTQLTLLGYDRWAEACEIARQAAEQSGMSTTVDVR